MTSIPIFLCTDNDYAVPTYITLFSLLKNYRGTRPLSIYLLTPSSLSHKNARLLRKLSGVKIINMKDSYSSVSINTPWISTATMYRLLIPKIARGIEKCIYLDSDVVVEGDISELFNIGVEGYCLAAVKERTVSCDRDIELKEKLGVPSLKDYINAGVLLLNIKEIEGLADKLAKAGYRNDYPHNDQDAINAICYGSIKTLPLRYNAINHHVFDPFEDNVSQYGRAGIREERRDPLIIHYTGIYKPWAYKATRFGDRWWNYVKMQDEEVMRRHIRPFIKASKLPFRAVARERVKDITKKLGIYLTVCDLYQRAKNAFR